MFSGRNTAVVIVLDNFSAQANKKLRRMSSTISALRIGQCDHNDVSVSLTDTHKHPSSTFRCQIVAKHRGQENASIIRTSHRIVRH